MVCILVPFVQMIERLTLNLQRKVLILMKQKKKRRIALVMCLCSNHLQNYKRRRHFYIRRFEPCTKTKCPCEICGKAGYDYFVYKKPSEVSQ